MSMVGDQDPGETLSFGFRQQAPEAFEQIGSIGVAAKYQPSFNPPDDFVVHRSGGIYPGLSKHSRRLQ